MKPKKLQYGLLNIVTQPHSPALYIKLFREAARKRITVHLGGSDRGLIGEPFTSKTGKREYLYGYLHRYSTLDPNSWINLNTLDELAEDDMNKVAGLQNFGPNHRRFPFFFFPDVHVMVVVTRYNNKSMSIDAIRKMLEVIFQSSELSDWGPADVNIFQDSAVLDDIKHLKKIKSIKMKVSLPNSDSAHLAYTSLFHKMTDAGARQANLEYYAKKNDGLNYTPELERDLEDTLSNGGSVVEGVQPDGTQVSINTLASPRIFYLSSLEEMEILREEVTSHAISKNKDIFRPHVE